jgi:hypothetical protein
MVPRIAIGLLVVPLLSCGGPGGERGAPFAPPEFETRTLDVRGGECATPDVRCARVEARWIEATAGTEPFRRALNRFVQDRLASGLRGIVPEDAAVEDAGVPALADAFVNAYAAFQREFPDSSLAWFHRFSAEIAVSSPRVVTVLVVDQSYTGGAHGLERLAYASFRPDTGAPVGLDDLVTDRDALTAAGEGRFREARRVADDESLAEAGFTFDGDAFSLPDNFGVFPEGIRFRWDAYEIAAYATGPTEITVEWSELSGVLREDAPLP